MKRRSIAVTTHRQRAPLAAALLLALVTAAAGAEPGTTVPCEKVESIGVATMTEDGTITLRLRSLPPGPIAEGTMSYRPGDPQYEEVKRHLGGIKPGEAKPVRPWC